MYELWYESENQNLEKKQNCVIWIQTVSLYASKQASCFKPLLII